ncbi:PP2C family protein-serine/threonine phosphatase [Magnetospira sp. QH-2]|uniref:PP2C family protein-serine/threonine phosphatase n=1 Tax=Magnetospira sp. (strain QH-2) TaxID=1288970 RepID=UPI0003E818F4|nr:SpoIIE family protein phosphatase [Magnetospira sp. QH-2]CCQ74181.1 Protein of unknown function [Magnetospira sp. QH-2]
MFEINNGKTQITKGTKKGIGYRSIPHDQKYDIHEISITQDQAFYMTSDGILDQIGGPKRLGFGKKRLMNLLVEIQGKSMSDQMTTINQALLEYQGDESRRDDISVIGFKL